MTQLDSARTGVITTGVACVVLREDAKPGFVAEYVALDVDVFSDTTTNAHQG